MNENWAKLLATISCGLLIVCGFPPHADGAEYSVNLDDILRSVAAVRAQLEPVLKNRLPHRTTEQSPVVREGSGGNRRVPGLLQFIKGASRNQPPASSKLPPVLYIPIEPDSDGTKAVVPDITTVGPLASTTWLTTPKRRRIKTKRPTVQPITMPATGTDDDTLRANPLGIIIPSPDQLNYFQQRQRKPSPTPEKHPTSTSTIGPPQVIDFYFPQDSIEDQNGGSGAVYPVTRFSVTTTVRPRWSTIQSGVGSTIAPFNSTASASISPTPNATVDPVEGETTVPPEEEEGLGNRIDPKVLLSLVG